jgi:hypothetical protein
MQWMCDKNYNQHYHCSPYIYVYEIKKTHSIILHISYFAPSTFIWIDFFHTAKCSIQSFSLSLSQGGQKIFGESEHTFAVVFLLLTRKKNKYIKQQWKHKNKYACMCCYSRHVSFINHTDK